MTPVGLTTEEDSWLPSETSIPSLCPPHPAGRSVKPTSRCHPDHPTPQSPPEHPQQLPTGPFGLCRRHLDDQLFPHRRVTTQQRLQRLIWVTPLSSVQYF